MADFRVRWEIDVDADNAFEAARKALLIQRTPNSTATHFTVIPEVGEHIPIDLGYSFEEYLIEAMNTPTALRRGQFAVNLLFDKRPDLCGKLDIDLDPFYQDIRIPQFLTWVGENW